MKFATKPAPQGPSRAEPPAPSGPSSPTHSRSARERPLGRGAVPRMAAMAAIASGLGSSLASCVAPPPEAPNNAASLQGAAVAGPPEPPSPFHLKPEWTGPCARTDTVDVNLGNSPEAFVKAAYCQITGQDAPAKTVELWSGRLRTDAHVRRIDVVRAIAVQQKREIKLSYSDPWAEEPELGDAPVRQSKRDIGAVCMFFFSCPSGTNCGMDWANTHALGMAVPHPLLGNGPAPGGAGGASASAGFYSPSEPGFWRRELLDAKYAGLQFLMLNTYGL